MHVLYELHFLHGEYCSHVPALQVLETHEGAAQLLLSARVLAQNEQRKSQPLNA
jgi:hypothetical protein